MKNFLVLILSATLLVGTGCSEDDSVTPSQRTASVRVVHASYDAPNVDVRVDGNVAITNLAYQASSGYASVNEGQRRLSVTPNGETTPVVIDVSPTLVASRNYTVFATGALANIQPLLVEDSLSAPANGKVKVRLVHLSPDAPAVDVKVNSGAGVAVFSNRSFRTATAYSEVDAGSYRFVITAAGQTEEVAAYEPISLTAGTIYTIVALGTLNATDNFPFTVRAFIDNAQSGLNSVALTAGQPSPRVNVIHASPNAPSVDLLIDNVKINSAALAFPQNTGYLPLLAGTRNIKVNPAGATTSVIDADLLFEANKNYSVFAIDSVSKISAIVTTDDLTAPAAGKAHVRFIHLSPNAPAVDVSVVGQAAGAGLFLNRTFNKSISSAEQAFTPVDAGTVNLEVRVAGTTTVALAVGNVTLEAGKIYTIFAKGFLGGTGATALGAEIIVNR